MPQLKISNKKNSYIWYAIKSAAEVITTRSNSVWQRKRRAPLWPFMLVRADPCSLLRETAGAKLQGISGDLFCHNKGIKKRTENLWPMVGGPAIVLVEITVPRHRAGPYCLKEDPLWVLTGLKAAPRLSLQWRDERVSQPRFTLGLFHLISTNCGLPPYEAKALRVLQKPCTSSNTFVTFFSFIG